MDGDKMQENQPLVPERSKVFDVVYMLVFIVLLGFLVYVYGINFNDYDENELIKMAYYFVPAFFFSVTGLIAIKNPKSIVFALIAAVVSEVLLLILLKLFWSAV